MIPFLGINLTQDKKNETINGDVFLVAKPSSALTQALEQSSETTDDLVEKSKLPLPIRIVQYTCGLLAALLIFSLIRAMGGTNGVTIIEAYQNAPWIFWLSGICLLIWLPLKLLSRHRETAVLKTEESTLAFTNLDRTCDAILSELDIPLTSREIDLLSFYYKEKGNDIKVCEKGMQLAPYINSAFHVFSDSENLYFGNIDGKYAIPRSAVKAIKTVKKNIPLAGWNKEIPYNYGIYKPFKLGADNYGRIHCKKYHIMEVEYNGTLWGIYIPCYELPVIEKLTGLKASAI